MCSRDVNGGNVRGVYRRSVQLRSGRFAMLDDGIGFSSRALETLCRTAARAERRWRDAGRVAILEPLAPAWDPRQRGIGV
jgi:hypothetical protein